MPVITSPEIGTPKRSGIKCCCDKVCKGARGLKMHQRSCRVILGLNNELRADLDEENNDIYPDDISNNAQCNSNAGETHEEFPFLKKGINLPQSDKEWSTANEYFKFALNLNPPISSQDINSFIVLLNDVICNYFADNFGHVESPPDRKPGLGKNPDSCPRLAFKKPGLDNRKPGLDNRKPGLQIENTGFDETGF